MKNIIEGKIIQKQWPCSEGDNDLQDYQNLVDTIRLAAPFFDDFILRPTQYNKEFIKLEWKERGSDAYFNAHSLSDGTLRFKSKTKEFKPFFIRTLDNSK